MTHRGEQTEASPTPGRSWTLTVVACALAAGLLGGCSTVSDMFGDDEPQVESSVSTPPEAAGDQPFPNLSTVPDEPPQTSSAAERAAILEGLAADRANAEYTDEKLGQQAIAPSSAAPSSAAPSSAVQPRATEAPTAEPSTAQPPAVTAATTAPAPAAPAPAPAAPAPEPAAALPMPAPTPAPAPAPIPAGSPAPAAPAVQSAPLPAPTPAPSAPLATQTAQQPAPSQAAPQPAPGFPPAGQQQVLENGSVIVNPEAVLGSGNPAGSRLLPSGESRPVALIFFRYGSAGLSNNDVNVLKEVTSLHQERGGLVRVIGHASQGNGGGDVVKQRLANFNISLARANAVARELSRLGVPIDEIQVAAAGAQQPIYYESTPTGEAGNRRVEIYLDY